MSQEQFLQRSPALPLVELRQADRSTACYQAHTHDEFSFGVIDQGHTAYCNRQRRERKCATAGSAGWAAQRRARGCGAWCAAAMWGAGYSRGKRTAILAAAAK